LIRPIGEGGTASVWWAHDQKLDREVAIKLVASRDPVRTARLLPDAQTLGRFDPPNIVGIVDAGELPGEGCLFLAMELLRGSSFADRMTPGEPLPTEEALAVLIEVSRGLEVAHAS